MQSLEDHIEAMASKRHAATGDARWALPARSDQADTTPGPTRVDRDPRGDERGAAFCPLCKGSGWLKRYANGTDVLAGASLEACDCKREELQRNAWEKARRNSGLPVICHHQTFGNYRQDNQPEAFRAATAYCTKPDHRWLILQGEAGTGKTHLAAAIVNRLLTLPGWRPLYYVVPDLLDHLRSITFREGEARERGDREWKAIREASVLVLDDYGSEKGSDWTDETLFKLIDYRYVNELPLVVTTNLPFNDPELMPSRIASRFQDIARSQVVTLRQGDYRRSKQRLADRDPWDEE